MPHRAAQTSPFSFQLLNIWPYETTRPDDIRQAEPIANEKIFDMLHEMRGRVTSLVISVDELSKKGLPTSSRVLASYMRPNGRLVLFGCDAFDHWSLNLREILLCIDYMSSLDQSKAIHDEQHYIGFYEDERTHRVSFDLDWAMSYVAAHVKLSPEDLNDRQTLQRALSLSAETFHHNKDAAKLIDITRAHEILRHHFKV